MRWNEILEYEEEPGSAFGHEGRTYDLNVILRKSIGLPVVEFRVSDLEWVIDQPPTEDRVERANLMAPVLVTRWNGKLLIIDGYHRLNRAKREGRETILGKLVPYEWLAEAEAN